MRIRVSGVVTLLLVVSLGEARAGRRQILRALASAVYATSAQVDLPPASCACVDAICQGAIDVILACGSAGVAAGSASASTRIIVMQPAAATDGRSECNVCGCNDGQTETITLQAEGTCVAVPGRR